MNKAHSTPNAQHSCPPVTSGSGTMCNGVDVLFIISLQRYKIKLIVKRKELLFSIYDQKKSKIVSVYRIFIYFCSRITKAKQYNENEL